MTATYTFDVFCSLDGFGSHHGDWGGYWGKQGPELLERRRALYDEDQRMVFGAKWFGDFVQMISPDGETPAVDDWVTRMRDLPAIVVSASPIEAPTSWADATVLSGDAVDIVARLKEESDVPLRSHGSLVLNRALLAAGLIDVIQVTVFPVITGQTGDGRVFEDAADVDLELLDSRTLDGRTQELLYRPTLH